MIRVLLCCGGGFSSSALAQKAKNEIIAKGYSDKMSIEFSPFALSFEVMHNYDIIVCCPHLKMHVISSLKDMEVNIPIYLLPPRMYALLDVVEIYQDCIDIIDLYKNGKSNPVCFDGEENLMRIQRIKAHSHTYNLK